MSTFANGMNNAAEQGEGAMTKINAGISNVAGAVNEIGADAAAQGEKAKARWGAFKGNLAGFTARAKGKIGNMKQAAQAKMAEAKAAKAGKSSQDLFNEVLPDPIGSLTSLPGKALDAAHQTGEYMGARKEEAKQGFERGVQEFHSQKSQEAPTASGGRRRRRRRTRRKKRRKSRKSRRKRRKSRKKKRRKSRKKSRHRRRR